MLTRIRELVRNLNFHLLQLARPEAVFGLRTVLPVDYLTEYVVRQDHFAVSNFLLGLMEASLTKPLAAPPTKCLCVTRTCTEIASLRPHTETRAQALFGLPLVFLSEDDHAHGTKEEEEGGRIGGACLF